ncbi:hypothetical protein ACOZB4_10470 [Paenibacillus sp. NPDC058898]
MAVSIFSKIQLHEPKAEPFIMTANELRVDNNLFMYQKMIN